MTKGMCGNASLKPRVLGPVLKLEMEGERGRDLDEVALEVWE